jgi:hypothetical protein
LDGWFGAEQVHAGQRGDAQLADFVTQEHLRLDVDHRVDGPGAA